MTALWLAALALAGEDQAALTARLLGPEPATTAVAATADPTGGVRVGLLVFGVLAVAVSLYWIRALLIQHRAGPTAVPALRVISRASLGGPAALAVVEVVDGGEVSRFLVGYGGGPPVLLSALSADLPPALPAGDGRLEPMRSREDVDVAPVDPREFVPVETRDDEDDAPPMNPLAARFARAAGETPSDLAARKRAARQMIDEALASRRRMSA